MALLSVEDAGSIVGGSSDSSGGTDASGWLSGLGDLFQGVGAAVSSGIAASNAPSAKVPTGWVYNPATGGYYNPATGQAITSTGGLSSVPGFTGNLFGGNSFLYILVFGFIAYLLLRRKEA